MKASFLLAFFLEVCSPFVECKQESIHMTELLENFISLNSNCHIHLVFDEAYINSLKITNSVTIRRLPGWQRLDAHRFPENLTILTTKVKGMHCFYVLFVRLSSMPKTRTTVELEFLKDMKRADENIQRQIEDSGLKFIEAEQISYGSLMEIDAGLLLKENSMNRAAEKTDWLRRRYLIYNEAVLIIFSRLPPNYIVDGGKLYRTELEYRSFSKIGLVVYKNKNLFPHRKQISSLALNTILDSFASYFFNLNCNCESDYFTEKSLVVLANLTHFQKFLEDDDNLNSIMEIRIKNPNGEMSLEELSKTFNPFPDVINPFRSAITSGRKLLNNRADAQKIAEFFLIATAMNVSSSYKEYNEENRNECKYSRKSYDKYRLIYTSRVSQRMFQNSYFRCLQCPKIYIQTKSVSFLTCYHLPVFTFKMYLDPFQLDLWIVFLSTAVFVTIFLFVVIRIKFSSPRWKSFSPFLFVLSTITDDSCGMPGELRDAVSVRFSMGPWFLASVVFVNAYIGTVISSLTTPFELTSIHSFENLTEISYRHPTIVENQLWLRHFLKGYNDVYGVKELYSLFNTSLDFINTPKAKFKVMSSLHYMVDDDLIPQNDILLAVQTIGQILINCGSKLVGDFMLTLEIVEDRRDVLAIVNRIKEEQAGFPRSIAYENELLFNLYKSSAVQLPENYHPYIKYVTISQHQFQRIDQLKLQFLIEKEIVKCGRSVYADYSTEVKNEFQYLSEHYHWIKFFISQEEILHQQNIWVFFKLEESSVFLKNIKLLFSSGIYFQVVNFFVNSADYARINQTYSNPMLKEHNARGPAPISLNDKIQTAFFVFSFLVGISWLCFVSEIIFVILNVKSFFRSLILSIVLTSRLARKIFIRVYPLPKVITYVEVF